MHTLRHEQCVTVICMTKFICYSNFAWRWFFVFKPTHAVLYLYKVTFVPLHCVQTLTALSKIKIVYINYMICYGIRKQILW